MPRLRKRRSRSGSGSRSRQTSAGSDQEQGQATMRVKTRRRRGWRSSRSKRAQVKKEDPLFVAVIYCGGVLLVMGLGVLFFQGLEQYYSPPRGRGTRMRASIQQVVKDGPGLAIATIRDESMKKPRHMPG